MKPLANMASALIGELEKIGRFIGCSDGPEEVLSNIIYQYTVYIFWISIYI